MNTVIPTALMVAGSDSGGGAGIQADLKAFAACGVYGMSVLTAITAQNTCGVTAVRDLDAEIIAAQMQAVFDDIPVLVDNYKLGKAQTAHQRALNNDRQISSRISDVMNPNKSLQDRFLSFLTPFYLQSFCLLLQYKLHHLLRFPYIHLNMLHKLDLKQLHQHLLKCQYIQLS